VEAVAFWKESLEKYPAERIERAFKEHLRTSEFFPKPSQIIELLQEYAYDDGPTLVEKVRAQLKS